MTYAVTFTAAAKSLEKLERQLIGRIKTKVLDLALNPRPSGSIKLSGASDLHRIRIGAYRIIYSIDDAKETVEITIVAHRQRAWAARQSAVLMGCSII